MSHRFITVYGGADPSSRNTRDWLTERGTPFHAVDSEAAGVKLDGIRAHYELLPDNPVVVVDDLVEGHNIRSVWTGHQPERLSRVA